MTRLAILAASEELRARLAAALSADPSFDIVSSGVSADDVAPSADVVLVAREAPPVSPVRRRRAERASEPALTNRELEILALLAEGLANKQIAARLGIATNTVKTHVELLFDRLRVSSRAEAVAAGVKRGLLLF